MRYSKNQKFSKIGLIIIDKSEVKFLLLRDSLPESAQSKNSKSIYLLRKYIF